MRKVLHVVEDLNRGAVENWLVRMLRHARSQGQPVDWDFYCVSGSKGVLDDEARALGAKVIHSPVQIGEKLAFMGALRSQVNAGQYNILHCHHDLVSAAYLVASLGTSVRWRIVHIHNADEQVLTPSALKQLLYRGPMRHACLAIADLVVGNSNHSLDHFLSGRRRRPGRDRVHYYGIDPAPFERRELARDRFRAELGLAQDAQILLFAGRMVPEKNPLFSVDVLAELHRLDPRVAGVFVGAGSLTEPVAQRASQTSLNAIFRHMGWRDDIPDIMGCCDWFILSRPDGPMEGFGIAVVEAQLAALRMLLSDRIADDPLLPSACFKRLPLAAGPAAWAEAAIDLREYTMPSRTAAFADFQRSPMAMSAALNDLLTLHDYDRKLA